MFSVSRRGEDRPVLFQEVIDPVLREDAAPERRGQLARLVRRQILPPQGAFVIRFQRPDLLLLGEQGGARLFVRPQRRVRAGKALLHRADPRDPGVVPVRPLPLPRSRQPGEEVAEERVPVDRLHAADREPSGLRRVGEIVRGNGRRGDRVPEEAFLFVKEPRDGGHVPDHAGPGLAGGVALRLAHGVFDQIVAEGVFAAEPVLKLVAGGREPVHDPEAGELHDRHAAGKEHPRAGDILLHIELRGGARDMRRVPAEPDDDHALAHLRREEQGGGDVRDRADRRDIEGLLRRMGRRLAAEELRRRREDGRVFVGEVTLRAAVNGGEKVLPPRKRKELADLPVAFFHPVGGRGSASVEERRRRDPSDPAPLAEGEQVGERELIVDLVVGVGIEDDVDPPPRAFVGCEKAVVFHKSSLLEICFYHTTNAERSQTVFFLFFALFAPRLPTKIRIRKVCRTHRIRTKTGDPARDQEPFSVRQAPRRLPKEASGALYRFVQLFLEISTSQTRDW